MSESISAATTPAEVSNENRGELSDEEIFDVLSNRRRRYVIHALKHAERPIGVSELSRHVTAWERGVEPEEVTYEERRNVYSTLQRIHIPKLEENNVVAVDDTENMIRPTDELRNLEIYVEVLRSREIPWSTYYLGLVGVCAALLFAVMTDIPGFAALSSLSVGLFAATAFSVSAIAHHFIGRRTRLGHTEKPTELHAHE
ncbi:DUF7344 domain-containing protein [Halorubrum sp. DTA46]|uniref:DUF7344 domain-containing protein n=1 Tax=Halorubrum sp. DTA46 TaxID=3402162 RepID=UPI003AAF9D09